MTEESNVTVENLAPEEAVDVATEAVEEVENTEAPVDNEDLFASRFSALSKREKRMVETQAKIKEQEARFAEMEAAKQGGAMELLKYHGLSIDDVISHALGEDAPQEEVDPNQQLREEFEAYKKGIEDKEAERLAETEKKNQDSIERAINEHKQTISSHISQNPDRYELINSQDEHELVWEVTEANFNETGEVLSVEEAADKVEAFLENKVRELLKLKKFGSQESEQIKDKYLGKKESPTLTNRYNTQTVPVTQKGLSREQSMKQAASLLKWS